MKKDSYLCLGIESTAHTFGVAVVDSSGRVLSNVKDSYETTTGGMIPSKVAEHHVIRCHKVAEEALKKARASIKDISLISVSQSPGIGHMLRVGAMFGRSISAAHNIEIVGVNHCIAHLEIGRLITKAEDPVFLYASGANTQIIAYDSGRYRIFGETLDMGLGNMLDSFARNAGLGFPGGPKIEVLAKKGNELIKLPYLVKGMDLSFTGLLTSASTKIGSYPLEDIAYSLQETAFAMLIEVCERAIAHTGKKSLLLGGGVACNSRLQQMANQMCDDRGARCCIPSRELLMDNGAMIGWLGILEHNAGVKMKIDEIVPKPNVRTDEVEVLWR